MGAHQITILYSPKLLINKFMLTIIFVLLFLWLIGFLGFHILGPFIHILLALAVIMFLWRVIQGKNPLK